MKYLFASLLWFYCLRVQAQVYLLPDFTWSVATMKNGGQPVRAAFNYNCLTQCMEFLEGDDILQLASIHSIDTLYLDTHKMIPYGTRFLDVLYVSPRFTLLLDYRRRKVNEGKVGAMGLKTQGTVENIDVSAVGGRPTDSWKKGNQVWKVKNENTYLYVEKNKMKRFHNEKSLLKLFPHHAGIIRQAFKDNKVRLDQPASVAELLQSFYP